MKKIREYLPLHFTVLLILGIVIQFYTQFWCYGFTSLLILVASILLLLSIFKNRVVTTILSFGIFFFVGVSSVYFNNDRNYNNYYKKYLVKNALVTFKVSKVLKPSIYNDKYEVEVVKIDSKSTIGNILLNVKKDSANSSLKVDELIISKAVFKELMSPLNPYQFNYKSYLAKQGMYQQLFVDSDEYKSLGYGNSSLKGLAARCRTKIQKSLLKYNFKNDELGVINALLLGQRQDISKELTTDYQKAGAIHILAVSGLHVGVILLILSFLFKPIERLKNGAFLKAFLIVLVLWAFAFIAGLSASVVRAVTMFTFLAIGLSFHKKNVVFFSLISSLFFLLIAKPMFLFDVGFQLSYLAVFGIIWIQPKLYAVWKPKFKMVDFFWQLFTVSIAAQVGVLALSIYYFQQFPTLFLLSNLVIVPCLMYILIGGVLVFLLALLNLLPQFFADIYGSVISLMNGFVSWISMQEQFLLKEISISLIMMVSIYVFIFSGVQFLIHRKAKKLLYFVLAIFILQIIFLYELKENNDQKELIIFHKSRKSVIGERIGKRLFLQHNLDTLNFKNDYSLKSYRISEKIEQIHQATFNNFINFQNKNILIVDSLGVYKIKGLVKPIVVLQNSPKINLLRLLQHLDPIQIVADGSNYRSDINRWEIICAKQDVPFHYTGDKGAFILKH
jgi:competence protein ComEC